MKTIHVYIQEQKVVRIIFFFQEVRISYDNFLRIQTNKFV